jgi:hypothetical protein
MEALAQKRELDEETQSKVRFITFIITMFARAYKMNKQDAYLYLAKYGGLDYLFKHWWTLHCEDPYWSVRALYAACYKNGGMK